MGQRLTTMNVSLPTTLRDFVQARVDEGGFANVSEYVRYLIREERKSDAAQIEAMLEEAVASGPAKPLSKRDWERIRAGGAEKAKALRSRRRRSA